MYNYCTQRSGSNLKGFNTLRDSSRHQPLATWKWHGSQNRHLDMPEVTCCGKVVIGCYGGNTQAGADSNEDGALVWSADDETWELAMLLDGHCSTESVELILTTLHAKAAAVRALLSQDVEIAFPSLHQFLFALFRSPAFLRQCQQVRGETSCLICVRKAQFLWWLCVGDCVVYLLHPELAQRSQFALNHRNFFEWIGQVNTFDLLTPCYTTGIRELRSGRNRIVMTTDGLLEFGSRSFERPQQVYKEFLQDGKEDLKERVLAALFQVHQAQGQDSATVIAWDYENTSQASYPSC